MTLAWIIYFIDVLCDNDGIGLFTFMTTFLWVIGFVVSVMATMCGDDDQEAIKYLKFYKSMWPIKLVACLLIVYGILIHSKDTAYKMLAAYGVESIVTNDKVQELGGKSLDVLNKAMDDYLKESEPTKEEK